MPVACALFAGPTPSPTNAPTPSPTLGESQPNHRMVPQGTNNLRLSPAVLLPYRSHPTTSASPLPRSSGSSDRCRRCCLSPQPTTWFDPTPPCPAQSLPLFPQLRRPRPPRRRAHHRLQVRINRNTMPLREGLSLAVMSVSVQRFECLTAGIPSCRPVLSESLPTRHPVKTVGTRVAGDSICKPRPFVRASTK